MQTVEQEKSLEISQNLVAAENQAEELVRRYNLSTNIVVREC